jgi:hypothetical protein
MIARAGSDYTAIQTEKPLHNIAGRAA